MRERKHFRMCSDMVQGAQCGYAPIDDLGCAEETEVRSTLFSCVKHSHSSFYVEQCAAPAVALRYQLTLYK